MTWTKPLILQALKKHRKKNTDLSYSALARKDQSLVSAAAYHFGSYRQATEKAGLDYAELTRRPRWTRPAIIKLLKSAYRSGKDLHWSAVTAKKNELARAAFASLQPRLFGSWDRALHAAGLDAGEISRYRAWDKHTIIADLKELAASESALNSGAVQHDDPGLHAAAVRHFSSFDKALRAAGINPANVRQRRSWSKAEVLSALQQLHRKKESLSDSVIRKSHPAIYGASLRLFGTFKSARTAAGIKLKSHTPAGRK